MVFDAHERAFGFPKGACARGICDNMKTVVETKILVGKDRQWHQAASCRCARIISSSRSLARQRLAGEKGQVENQVGPVREGALLHAAAAVQELRRAERSGLRTNASPGPRRTAIPSGPTRRFGRCSRRSGPSSFPIAAAST